MNYTNDKTTPTNPLGKPIELRTPRTITNDIFQELSIYDSNRKTEETRYNNQNRKSFYSIRLDGISQERSSMKKICKNEQTDFQLIYAEFDSVFHYLCALMADAPGGYFCSYDDAITRIKSEYDFEQSKAEKIVSLLIKYQVIFKLTYDDNSGYMPEEVLTSRYPIFTYELLANRAYKDRERDQRRNEKNKKARKEEITNPIPPAMTKQDEEFYNSLNNDTDILDKTSNNDYTYDPNNDYVF